MILNKESLDLILEHEVGGGERYYNLKLKRPTYPGGDSGVTIGIGYDLGYVDKDEFAKDWSSLDKNILNRLLKSIGLKRGAAKSFCQDVKDIEIPFDLALDVFNKKTVIKFYSWAKSIFPCFDDLHPNAQGALISLVFNRGKSLIGSTRQEMKNITYLTCKKDYKGIASEIRKMKRLWVGKGLDGLLRRRDDEAKLVEKSI